MRKWLPLAIDVLIVIAWGGVIWVVGRSMSSRVELLTFVWATFLAGLLSGRFRIVVAPVMPFIAIAFAAIFLPDNCDPTARCEEDPLWFGLIFLALLALASSVLMALGVLVRQWWDGLLRPRPAEPGSTAAIKDT